MRVLALAVLGLGSLAATQNCPPPKGCPPQGSFLVLSPSGPATLGSPLSVSISGTPGEPYALFMDSAPASTIIPGLGCVAVALTPSFQTVISGFSFPFAVIPPNGTAILNFGIPNDTKLLGTKAFFQAGVRSRTAPFLSLSNGSCIDIRRRPLRMFVCDRDPNWFRILDFNSPSCPVYAKPIGSVNLSGIPHRIAADLKAGRLYIARWSSQDIQILDMNTMKVVGAIPSVPAPVHLAFDSSSQALFVLTKTSKQDWQVRRYDVLTNKVTHTWAPVPAVNGAPINWEEAEIVLEPNGKRVFFSRPKGITVLNANNLTLVGHLLAPPPKEQAGVFRGLTFRPGTQEIWAGGVTGVWIVDTSKLQFVDMVGKPTFSAAYPVGGVRDVVFDLATGLAYSNSDSTNDLIRMKPGVQSVSRFALLMPASNKLGISPGGSHLVVTTRCSCTFTCGFSPRVIKLGAIPSKLCDLGQHGGKGLFTCYGGTGDIIFY